MNDSPNTAETARKEAIEATAKPVHANGNGHAAVATDEVERLLSTGAKMFDQTRRKIVRLMSEHDRKRLAIEDRYRTAIEELGFAAGDELRALDREHAKALTEQRRILAALSAVRDA